MKCYIGIRKRFKLDGNSLLSATPYQVIHGRLDASALQ